MNKLPLVKRVQILSMLCEGSSMRSTARVADVAVGTVVKLLVDAGKACSAFHDEKVRGVKAKRVQVDEIWSFTYAKAKNVPTAKAAPEDAGDTWTSTALDADTKLIVSWLVGGRDSEYAMAFVDDLRSRLANRVQLTSDGHSPYLEAVEEAFGDDIDYAMLVKLYGAAQAEGAPGSAQRRYSPAGRRWRQRPAVMPRAAGLPARGAREAVATMASECMLLTGLDERSSAKGYNYLTGWTGPQPGPSATPMRLRARASRPRTTGRRGRPTQRPRRVMEPPAAQCATAYYRREHDPLAPVQRGLLWELTP